MKITEKQAAIARMILEDERHPEEALFANAGEREIVNAFRDFGWNYRVLENCFGLEPSGKFNANQLRTALAFVVTLGEDK